MSKGLSQDGNIKKLYKTGMSAVKFFWNKSLRVDQYMSFITNPDIKIAKQMINIFDNKHIISAYQINLTYVKINEVIYIPKLQPELDMNAMKELYSLEAMTRLEEIKGYPTQQQSYEFNFDNRDK